MKATIVSLWHTPFPVVRPYQNYPIPPRPDNGLLITDPKFSETYGSLVVGEASQKMDIGDNRKLPQTIDAYAIADDIVASDQLTGYGVFVADADAPTKEELRIAQAILLRKARTLIGEGDIKFSRVETRKDISDLNRWAVVQLEEKRDWVYQRPDDTLVKVHPPVCPNCGSEAKILDPASCWNCAFIMDVKRARQLGLLPGDEELVGAGPVRGAGGKFQPKPKE
jgi:predicted Zn-ribbon and HTH transcriptional regulator